MSALWIEGFAHVACQPGEPLPTLDLTLLERSLRRGLSDLIRLFMHTAQRALAMAERSAADTTLVLASAFGELGTAELIMKQAFEENSASPARFRHSVHNSAVGLLSISADNRLPGTAMAAGRDTVAMGLLEAGLSLAEGAERVLLVFAEESVPAFLRAGPDYGAAAAAFVLSATPGTRVRGRVSLPMRREPEVASLAPHPLAGALRLAQLCELRKPGTVVVGEGPRPYVVELDGLGSP